MAKYLATNDFVAKHWQRFPEWQLAAVFVPAEQRDLWFDWLALQNEWLLANSIEEEAPRNAKLAWWSEELRGWSRGMRRHPLGMHLQSASTHWSSVADALQTPLSIDALSRASALVDTDLFGTEVIADSLTPLLQAEAQIIGDDRAKLSLPKESTLPRLRAMQSAILRNRIRAKEVSKPLSPLRSTLICWTAARKSR